MTCLATFQASYFLRYIDNLFVLPSPNKMNCSAPKLFTICTFATDICRVLIQNPVSKALSMPRARQIPLVIHCFATTMGSNASKRYGALERKKGRNRQTRLKRQTKNSL